MKNGSYWVSLGCVLLWGLAFGAAAHAAQATLQGTIHDESGAVLPGVTVSARQVQTNVARSVVTDKQGRYTLPLDAGTYELQAVLPGFRSHAGEAVVAEGENRTLDLVLAIAPLAETVTVTRTVQDLSEVPSAITVVQQEDLQFGQRQVSPAEALGGIPGLFAENRNNFSLSGGVRLSIRAPLVVSGMRGLQIVQDGVPLTTADGTTQPGNIDLGSEGRVEVIRGPSSVLYGNSAGGVISLRSEFPAAQHLLVQPDIQFGSFGYQHQQIKASGTLGAFGYLLNVNSMKTDGFRTHSQAEVRKANLVVRAELSPRTEIRGVLNLYDMPFGENPSTLTLSDALNKPTSVRQQAIDQGWGEASTQGQGGVTLEHRFAGGEVFRATGWGLWRDVWNPIPSRVISLGRGGAGVRSEYGGTVRVGSRPIEWITGLDVSSQRDDRNEYPNAGVAAGGTRTRQGALALSQLENVLSVAPFAQVSIAFRPRWHLSVGARYDYYDFKSTDRFLSDGDQSGGRTLHAASPKVGVTYVASDHLNVYGNFATAYQTPTTQELQNRSSALGGFNADLRAADLRSFEIGARGLIEPWRLKYEVVGYASTLQNAFVPFQRPDERTYYVNAGESTRNGTEVLLEWTPIARVKTRLAYTYQDFTFSRFTIGGIDYAGKHEPSTPPQQLFLGGSYETSFGLRSSAQLRWVDAYAVNNANTISNPAYRVVDLRIAATRTWKNVEVRPYVGVDNVLDARYNGSTVANSLGDRFFEPSPSRAIYVGMTIGAGLK